MMGGKFIGQEASDFVTSVSYVPDQKIANDTK